MRRRRWLALVAGAAVAAAAGCSTLSYYGQAIGGHLEVMHRAAPIPERIADPATPPELRVKLERVLAIREFASRELALPDNGSYRSYADLGRPFVVWNVFAAPEFSVEPRQSCFPVVGCVGYRGYYAQAAADGFGDGLRKEGFDVFVYGVAAYSTLGWFDDPVLNTFIRYPDAELARLVFHELAHQVVYVKGDTTFNESFAVAVEEEGLRRWLEKNAAAAEREAYAASRARRAEFVRLVLRYRERAARLYGEPLSDDAKRAGKAKLFAELDADYRELKTNGWNGFAGYDRFFVGLNNAHLASVATYEELVPAFHALLAREGGDLPKFYAAVKELARLDKPERDRALAALMTR
ncbi:MAG TPA: aminopeptidase [Burkholderiales bacterium]|nr:aminopeptidase [Burkholderiales bacterium]